MIAKCRVQSPNERATLCFAAAFLPSPFVPIPHHPPPPCLRQVCQLPCRSELGQMVAGKKCLLGTKRADACRASRHRDADGRSGRRPAPAKPDVVVSSVAYFHPALFWSWPFSTSSASGRRAQAGCFPHVKCFSKAKAESRIYFPPHFWTLSCSVLFLDASHCQQS